MFQQFETIRSQILVNIRTWYESVGLRDFVDGKDDYEENPNRSPYDGLVFSTRLMYVLGILFSPFYVMGVVLGYRAQYKNFMPKDRPRLYHLPFKFVLLLLVGFGALGFFIGVSLLIMLLAYLSTKVGRIDTIGGFISAVWQIFPIVITTLIYILVSALFIRSFAKWFTVLVKENVERNRYGSARFATWDDLEDYRENYGLYVGSFAYQGGHDVMGYTPPSLKRMGYRKNGHMITVAGTRAGKGVNLILPNLLGKGIFKQSWVVVDPKGENLWHSEPYQRAITAYTDEAGNEKDGVIVLDPWGVHSSRLAMTSKNQVSTFQPQTLNPLDLIRDPNSDSLIDDLRSIAEMVVPISHHGNSHFDDRARTLVLALTAHLITQRERYAGRVTLYTVWEWLGDLNSILAEMVENDKGKNGAIVSTYALQFQQLRDTSEREFGSVVSGAQRHLDLFSSVELRRAMESTDFDISEINQRPMCLYIVIPPDKLKTHYKWLRLTVTTLLRAIVRRPANRVNFILDEFYALGYLSEIETAMGAYAGYNVTIWPVLQSFSQLKQLYPRSWENFVSNASILHTFGLNDLDSIQYVSQLAGETSALQYDAKGKISGSTRRPLMTPDEVRRGSQKYIFTFIDGKPIAQLEKLPYFEDPDLQLPNPNFPQKTPYRYRKDRPPGLDTV